MRTSLLPAAAILLLSITALPPRAHAVAKEIIELQTQVSQLQDMISQMKQSNDERMGVLLHLVQQNADSITRMTTQVGAMQQALSSQNENQQLSGQMQALNDSVDELKTRIGKLDATLQSMQAQLQNVQNPSTTGPTQPAAPPPTGPGTAENPPNLAPSQPPANDGGGNPAPPLQQTYQAALRDYNSAKYELSNSEFSDVIKYYPHDDMAGNAHFYMGEIAFRQGKYSQAVKQYDVVLEQFAGNPKAPAAQLRKGESLLQSQQREAGAQELRSLIQRYPQTPEAAEARSTLNGMGIRISPKPTAYR
ncbi:MAG TPA: tetratricopeptide repeat protein [Acidobacteriaceae bacterium]|nr:tetratricopeptide repeat protein [Acidobacteriaceae bacterium]